jgi:hypothetical protein
LDTVIPVVHETIGVENADLVSAIWVGKWEQSEITGTIRVRSEYVHDENGYGRLLKSSINVLSVGTSDLTSRIGVKLRNKMTGDSFVIGVQGNEIPMSVIAKRPYDMPSSIGVAPLNRMRGIINIVEPTVLADINTPIKDAFIREGLPKLNYGGEQIIGTGYSAGKEERLRILAGFDISRFLELPLNYELKRAELRLYYAYMKPEISLSLLETDDSWTENGVTWDNQPGPGLLVGIDYTVNEDDRYIAFDLSTYVNDARRDGKAVLNFYINATNEQDPALFVFSKERRSGLEPKIVIEYFDAQIWSFDTANLESRIMAVIRGNKSLASKLTVRGFWTTHDMPSSMFIVQPGERISRIVVSRPDMLGSITVRREEWNDLPSTIAVREPGYNDLENNTIMVSKPDLPSSLFVKKYTDMPSSFLVRVEGYSELFSWGTISAPDRPGSIYVTPYKDWPGSIAVRRSTEWEMPSSLYVSNPTIDCSIYVRFREDLAGSIDVRRNGEGELPGTVNVSKPYLPSSIWVTPYVDVSGLIRVRKRSESRIPATLFVSRPELQSRIWVTPYIDMAGSITVRRSDRLNMPSRLWVSHPTIKGRIYVTPYIDLPGSVTVRHSDRSKIDGTIFVSKPDLPSSVYVRFREDLTGSITARRDSLNEIDAGIVVSRPNLMGTIQPRLHYTLESSLVVRRSDLDDLDSNVYVLYRKEIPGQLDVWIKSDLQGSILVRSQYLNCSIVVPAYGDYEMEGSVIVRRSDVDSIPSTIQLRLHSDLPSTITVRRSNFKDLNGKVVVRVRDTSDLPTQINVVRFSNLPSSITVRRAEISERPSQIVVRRSEWSDLPSAINTLQFVTLPSRIVVRRSETSDIPSNIYVLNRDDLNSEILVRPYESLQGSIFVKYRGNEDTPGIIIPRVRGAYDIPTSLYTVARGNESLPSVIRVSPTNRMTGTVGIIAVRDEDLPSSIQLRLMDDIPGSITVQQVHYYDKSSTLWVRRTSEYDMPSSIALRIHSDLPSSLSLLHRKDLDCVIEIITDLPYAFIM